MSEARRLKRDNSEKDACWYGNNASFTCPLSGGGRAPDLSLVPTFIVVAVDATGMGIILPLLPFHSQRLGATPFIVGSLISAYALCQLIAGPVVGTLSDRYGRRRVLIVSQIGTLAGFVLLASANSLTLVFLARI